MSPPASGLDFGCGPGLALVAMGREAGFEMAGYDKFYADDPELLSREYDFITSTEVVEHLPTPRRAGRPLGPAQARRRAGRADPAGAGDERFRTWRYRQDPTHIVFFAEASFRALGARWRAEVEFPHADGRLHQTPEPGVFIWPPSWACWCFEPWNGCPYLHVDPHLIIAGRLATCNWRPRVC